MSSLAVFERSAYFLEAKTALAAVLKASHLTKTVFNRLVRDRDTVTKEDKSPVTVGDFAAQAVVSSLLQARFPQQPLVGEEDSSDLRQDEKSSLRQAVIEMANSILRYDTKDPEVENEWAEAKLGLNDSPVPTDDAWLAAIDRGNASQTDTGRCWALDPIDGTKGFLRGGQYAVCLSLLDQGKPVVGVIGCPNLPYPQFSSKNNQGSLFIAVKGYGAFQRSFDDPTLHRINFNDIAPEQTSESSFCESVEAGHSSHDTNARIAQILGIKKESTRMDSQAKYASICRGDGDIYLRLPVKKDYAEKIWDHASGAILVEEANGIVTDAHGKPLDFSLGRTLKQNSGVVAAGNRIHSHVIDAVKQALSETSKA